MRNVSILLALFSGCFALEGKKIVFPKATATDHVILKPTVEKALKQLTVCLRSYTDLRRDHSLFSIAMPGSGKDNTFLIFPQPPNRCNVFINGEQIDFRVDDEDLDWKHTCVAWDSETGLVQITINGKRYPIKGAKKGSPIGPEISVVLGQEQDNFGGGFEAGQSLLGEICDVNMWDYVLSLETMKAFTYGYASITGNIFNWKNGTREVKGGAVILEN